MSYTPPPAGGFGAPGPAYPPPAPLPPKKGMSGCLIAAIIVAVVGVPLLGTGSVLAIYGVRRYIANAKTAEARNALGMMARNAVSEWEASADEPAGQHLCASATGPVPADVAQVAGKKYQSAPGEWAVDAKRNAGFACLKFSMTTPQYYQYMYSASGAAMTATAKGDLDGDGEASTFELAGRIVGGRLVIAPTIAETNPEQ